MSITNLVAKHFSFEEAMNQWVNYPDTSAAADYNTARLSELANRIYQNIKGTQTYIIQRKETTMKDRLKHRKTFIEAMKLTRALIDSPDLKGADRIRVEALRTHLVSDEQEIQDLRTALSKSDRKSTALTDMIQTVAEKNGGLRHRIGRLQSLLGKANQKLEDLHRPSDAEVAEALTTLGALMDEYFAEPEDEAVFYEALEVLKDALRPAETEPVSLDIETDGGVVFRTNSSEGSC